eukprot:CAMPEP_0179469486 /NCGR_PEP_ID=MMETSP0799-20121207/50161_1 /TAXON_ID=46947 /ORGANISM="Geminigera cryophila, Strain CCMP2564" /LENGTH=37 /DNA_ID= /DNA_START= /DNA_END= /DNA_ORIENTATION=
MGMGHGNELWRIWERDMGLSDGKQAPWSDVACIQEAW